MKIGNSTLLLITNTYIPKQYANAYAQIKFSQQLQKYVPNVTFY